MSRQTSIPLGGAVRFPWHVIAPLVAAAFALAAVLRQGLVGGVGLGNDVERTIWL